MSQMFDVMENDFQDFYWRGQASGKPSTWTLRLYTANPGETGGGTEATYTGYASVSITPNLTNFSGTQGAGTTTASSGTGGTISNNTVFTFGSTATSGPQTLTGWALCNGSTPWTGGALTASRVINNGDVAPSFAAAALALTAA